jgi:hypothetical protein
MMADFGDVIFAVWWIFLSSFMEQDEKSVFSILLRPILNLEDEGTTLLQNIMI